MEDHKHTNGCVAAILALAASWAIATVLWMTSRRAGEALPALEAAHWFFWWGAVMLALVIFLALALWLRGRR